VDEITRFGLYSISVGVGAHYTLCAVRVKNKSHARQLNRRIGKERVTATAEEVSKSQRTDNKPKPSRTRRRATNARIRMGRGDERYLYTD